MIIINVLASWILCFASQYPRALNEFTNVINIETKYPKKQ